MEDYYYYYDAENDDFFEKTRSYQRYKIANLSEVERDGIVDGVYQMELNFNEEEMRKMLYETPTPNSEEHHKKVLIAATFDKSRLTSTLTHIGPLEAPFSMFNEYQARHEEKSRITVRVFATDVSNPAQVFKFKLYSYKENNQENYISCMNRAISDSFLLRLVSQHKRLQVSHPMIDLKKMAQHGDFDIRTAGFGNILGRPQLTKVVISGPHVNEDEAFDDFNQKGDLLFLHVWVIFESQKLKVRVSNKGGVLLFGVDLPIEEQLRLVTGIYDNVIKPYENGTVIMKKRRARNQTA